MQIFLELTTIVLIAIGVSFVMRLLRQPLVVGYILAGILAGPYFFNALQSEEHIELLSKIGITVLLFIVGLNLSPKVIKEVGKVSLVTGIGQVVFTSLIGYFICLAIGFDVVSSIYIAIALTFSSTIIILKLLSDKGDLNKLYGKISVGFLIVQDLIAALILIVVSSFAGAGNTSIPLLIGTTLAKGFAILLALYLITRYVFPKIIRFIASSQEFLFLFSIAWGLALSSLFYALGFSSEIGALIAGVTLSTTPFAFEIGSRMKPLRDFFIVLFFVLVGSHIQLNMISQILVPSIVLSLFILIGNPIIVVILMNLLGYKRKTGFMAGLTVAQISEFSLILVALGYSVGHISNDVLSLVAFVGIITIAGSTYMILYANAIYPQVEKFVKLFEWRRNIKEMLMQDETYETILFGYDRVGHDFVNTFKKLEKDYIVVDFNPHLIAEMHRKNIPHKYGDAEDVEFLGELHLDRIKLCVSTIPDFEIGLHLLKRIRRVNHSAIIILLCHNIDEAVELYKHGASYVMLPHYLSAKHTVHMIERLGFDKKEFDEEKEKHLAYIQEKEM